MSKTPKRKRTGLTADINEDRIRQLSNDLSEDIESGTVQEWRTVAKYFRAEFDKLHSEYQLIRRSVSGIMIAENMRDAAHKVMSAWLDRQNSKPE